jgi:hypothetical protein
MAVQVRRAGVGIADSVSQPPPRLPGLLTRARRPGRVARMSFLGTAILAFWADVDPSREAPLRRLAQSRAHARALRGARLPARRRYVAVAAPKCFMMYETKRWPRWPARLRRAPQPSHSVTQKCLALFRTRTARRADHGVDGRGSAGAATIRLGPRRGESRRAPVPALEVLPKSSAPGHLRRPLCEAGVETTTVKTKEKTSRQAGRGRAVSAPRRRPTPASSGQPVRGARAQDPEPAGPSPARDGSLRPASHREARTEPRMPARGFLLA